MKDYFAEEVEQAAPSTSKTSSPSKDYFAEEVMSQQAPTQTSQSFQDAPQSYDEMMQRDKAALAAGPQDSGLETIPEESPLNMWERGLVGMGTTLESKKAILERWGKQNVTITSDNKLLVDGKPYDSSVFSMKELVGDMMDHTGSLTEILPQIAADSAAITSGVGIPAIMMINAAGAAAGTGLRKGLAARLGGKEGGMKEFNQEMGVSAGIGAVTGGMPFAYGKAVRETGRVVTYLAKTLGDGFPQAAQTLAKIEPLASKHLLDLAKKGILPTSYIKPEMVKSEFIVGVAKNVLAGGADKEITPRNVAGQFRNLMNSAKDASGRIDITKQTKIIKMYQEAIPGLDSLTADDFRFLASHPTSHATEKTFGDLMSQSYADPKNMETIIGTFVKSAKDIQNALGEKIIPALEANMKPGMIDKRTLKVDDMAKRFLEGLQDTDINGPAILKGLDFSGKGTAAENRVIKLFLKTFFDASQATGESSGSYGKELYEALLKSGRISDPRTNPITHMSPRELVTFQKELRRGMDGLGDTKTMLGSYLSRFAKESREILQKELPKYGEASQDYHMFMEGLRGVGRGTGLEGVDSVPEAGNIILSALKDKYWQGIYSRNLESVMNLGRKVGINTDNVIDEVRRAHISETFHSAGLDDGVSKFAKAISSYVRPGENQAINALGFKSLDSALPNAFKFDEEATKHYVAQAFTNEKVDFYTLKSLFYLMGGSGIASGLSQMGVPPQLATGMGFLTGMKAMGGIANKKLWAQGMARTVAGKGGLEVLDKELGAMGTAAFRKSKLRFGAQQYGRQQLRD